MGHHLAVLLLKRWFQLPTLGGCMAHWVGCQRKWWFSSSVECPGWFFRTAWSIYIGYPYGYHWGAKTLGKDPNEFIVDISVQQISRESRHLGVHSDSPRMVQVSTRRQLDTGSRKNVQPSMGTSSSTNGRCSIAMLIAWSVKSCVRNQEKLGVFGGYELAAWWEWYTHHVKPLIGVWLVYYCG